MPLLIVIALVLAVAAYLLGRHGGERALRNRYVAPPGCPEEKT